MKYQSESELMKALGIESWRNLSKDKTVKFAAMMPDMDTELALKIVEQFPEFKSFALESLDVLEKQHKSTLSHNKESQENVHRAFREIREILRGELNREDLSPDERKNILGLIMETGNREFEKDSENKQFLESVFSKAAWTMAAVVGFGVLFVGGRAMVESGEIDENYFKS